MKIQITPCATKCVEEWGLALDYAEYNTYIL